MNKKIKGPDKKTIGIILAVAAVFIVGLAVWGMKQPQGMQSADVSPQSGNEQADIILYYGQECPHCKNVEKFIADNKIDEKIIFAKKEVWHNTANNAEMMEKAKECALDTDKIGVPFLFARSKCYEGEVDVENFLKKEAGIK